MTTRTVQLPLAYAVASVALCIFAPAAQATVILLGQQQFVGTSGEVRGGGIAETWSRSAQSTAPVEFFDRTLGDGLSVDGAEGASSAQLQSRTTSSLIDLSGYTNAFVDDPFDFETFSDNSRADSDVSYSVTFLITELTTFSLSASLNSIINSGNPCCGGLSLILRNNDVDGPTFNLSFGDRFSSTPFFQSVAIEGLLDPREYILELFASSEVDSFFESLPEGAGTQFTARLALGDTTSPVPAPPAVWLLMTALAPLGLRKALSLRRR